MAVVVVGFMVAEEEGFAVVAGDITAAGTPDRTVITAADIMVDTADTTVAGIPGGAAAITADEAGTGDIPATGGDSASALTGDGAGRMRTPIIPTDMGQW
jgi:hypothetical protein